MFITYYFFTILSILSSFCCLLVHPFQPPNLLTTTTTTSQRRSPYIVTSSKSSPRHRHHHLGDIFVLHNSHNNNKPTTTSITNNHGNNNDVGINDVSSSSSTNTNDLFLFRSSSPSKTTTTETTKKKKKKTQLWRKNIVVAIKEAIHKLLEKKIMITTNAVQKFQKLLKRRLFTVIMFFLVLFGPSLPTITNNNGSTMAAWAAAGPAGVTRSRSTGGRVSGSFGRSSSSRPSSPPKSSYSSPPSSTTRSYSNHPSSRPYYYQPRRPRIIVPPPTRHIHVYNNPSPHHTVIHRQQHYQRGPNVGDLILVTGTGLLITYGIMKHYNQDRDGDNTSLGGGFFFSGEQQGPKSALGYGVSVLSLTIALIVPDRFDSDSILSRLNQLASKTNSNSRRSVQKLVSSTTLELLRQEKAITSVGSDYKHYIKYQDAERQFNRMSLEKRSKFDKETFNNADGTIETTTKSNESSTMTSTATTAVIDISLCIEGDSLATKLSSIKNRSQLRDALKCISADSLVEDCLCNAEVLWTPDDETDNMSESDVYADYPTLFPLFD